ncbi:MAG TPA: CpsD/CapB family tyrosine-protein kinase [Candidatus Sulfotelmatobacter sp.]|jgi:Mrp family chromosome partitioning ATPase|nr:CpsD/CapB family tyrosine-protein kinase [Candidatus Sulfotelmatobacter sp.]
MSRNFELLQRLEQERAEARVVEIGSQQEPVHEPVFASPQAEVSSEWNVPVNVESRALETDALAKGEISKLVQRLFLLPNGSRTVAFAGVEKGNGCTWLTARAADLLATQIAGPVCVVDGNLRSPDLHNCWHVENGVGLADAITESDPIVNFCRRLNGSNLWLLTAGSAPADGQSWMGSEVLRSRMAELRAKFDFVLIDAPAVTQSGDAVAWGHMGDGVVMVLSANATRRESAHWAATELAAAGVRVIGSVLNKRTFPIPEKVYSKLRF